MTNKNIGIVAIATIAWLFCIVYVSYTVGKSSNTKQETSKQETVKQVNVNCIDGSRWSNVKVTYNHSTYDLYDVKWLARVPVGACALIATKTGE